MDARDAEVELNAPETDELTEANPVSILDCKEPVSAFNAANWSATAPPPKIFIAPSTVKVLPSQTNLSPKLNLLPLST